MRNVDILDRESDKSNSATEEANDERVPKKVNRLKSQASRSVRRRCVRQRYEPKT